MQGRITPLQAATSDEALARTDIDRLFAISALMAVINCDLLRADVTNRRARMPLEEKAENLDKPIWGVEAIAAAANLTLRQAYHALENGYLPGSKAGRKWFTTPRRLLARFSGED